MKANNRLLLCSLLALFLLFVFGCSGRGTYLDSADPRAAKVRFIAYAENATLDYYDADHCEGKTTGLLNNWFFTQSGRRVDMRVAPPANASAYLEISVPSETELFVQLNTTDKYGYSCNIPLQFRAGARQEYELTLYRRGRQCGAALEQLELLAGQVQRRKQPVLSDRHFTACIGRGPLFPK